MNPAKYNIIIIKGITFGPIRFEFKDEAKNAVDLTGWSVFADVRKTPKKELEFSLQPQITDAANGVITIAMSDEQTDALNAGAFGWDMVLENPGGERLGPYVAGKCSVETINTQP